MPHNARTTSWPGCATSVSRPRTHETPQNTDQESIPPPDPIVGRALNSRDAPPHGTRRNHLTETDFITGMGVVSLLGATTDEFERNLFQGRHGIVPPPRGTKRRPDRSGLRSRGGVRAGKSLPGPGMCHHRRERVRHPATNRAAQGLPHVDSHMDNQHGRNGNHRVGGTRPIPRSRVSLRIKCHEHRRRDTCHRPHSPVTSTKSMTGHLMGRQAPWKRSHQSSPYFATRYHPRLELQSWIHASTSM